MFSTGVPKYEQKANTLHTTDLAEGSMFAILSKPGLLLSQINTATRKHLSGVAVILCL